MGFLDKLFAPSAVKSTNRYAGLISQINNMEDTFKNKSDLELLKTTQTLKEKLTKNELDSLLPEAFAAVREAATRTIGQRHFDVQLIGGIVLHQGKIAEMKTGEGKTLVATLPLYLNALTGKGVHLITVNDFLAKFQGQWMGQIFNALGMSTGIIGHEQSWIYFPEIQSSDDPTWNHLKSVTRREAYRADITYGTNNEFGFDYLRDNMAPSFEQMSQRDLHYAIVDEVDSILIDEARTPLIISAPAKESTTLYQQFAQIAKKIKPEDYNLDEKERTITLNHDGIKKVESWLNIENLYDSANVSLIHHAEESLKAQYLFKKDKDYVVKEGEIIIVDEFTGRLMPGRRYSEGLHQAIEAKEGVEVKRESETLATISFQNLFRLYSKLSGMTGTALTESEEFWKIYGLEVVIVPTNKSMIRVDGQDRIYKNETSKYNAIVEEIKNRNQKGQPVLVGTISISKNEYLSKLLRIRGVKHQVLNAKHHEQEAKIIAQAGRVGSVTIATNIAGRGVDIILGGTAPEKEDNQEIDKESGLLTLTHDHRTIKEWQEEHNNVIQLGGLCVIGTERHEARRIDNQLRGRAGRQGDPGESIFYVSMEDELMRIFGGEKMKSMMDRLGLPDDIPIQHSLVSRSIEQAQKKVEGHNFDIRKHLVEYDDVMNKQREAIYRKRKLILQGKGRIDNEEVDIVEEILTLLSDEESQIFEQKIKKYGIVVMRQVCQQVYLQIIDQFWVDHLTIMDELRTGIGLRGYGQKDPLVEYKQEAFSMYERLIEGIEAQIIDILLKIETIHTNSNETNFASSNQDLIMEQGGIEETSGQVLSQDRPTPSVSILPENNFSTDVSLTVRKRGQIVEQSAGGTSISLNSISKVGRNDPCPCGATKEDGRPKKYKHCHGK